MELLLNLDLKLSMNQIELKPKLLEKANTFFFPSKIQKILLKSSCNIINLI
tara:strand:+ start:508 stop:660 length:153 start_codon:yes stop_codon:yes gene_type:complete